MSISTLYAALMALAAMKFFAYSTTRARLSRAGVCADRVVKS
jgi:hypothetical protein